MKKVEISVDEQWPIFELLNAEDSDDDLIDGDFVFELPEDLYDYFMDVCMEYRKIQMILSVMYRLMSNV